MGRIKNIKDVVDWGLCVGCGACYFACEKEAITLKNYHDHGIRPIVEKEKCGDDCACLNYCPGYEVDARLTQDKDYVPTKEDLEFGPVLEIWEGHATNEEIRLSASSGGLLSALALYCLEKEQMEFILHSEMHSDKPWENRTAISRTKDDLLLRTGSRYAPSSPCNKLELVEKSNNPCVFIGKPCDATAATMARYQRPQLDKNLGLILTFFCAGTPSTRATLDLFDSLGVRPDEINHVRYRGNGWPGLFNVKYFSGGEKRSKSLSYMDSWSELQKYRSFRCHLCPDGLGQVADIACGDAWQHYKNDGNPGLSIVLVRTKRGKEIVQGALENNYVSLERINKSQVIQAQGLISRKPEIFGRLLAMRFLLIPIPIFRQFALFKSWLKLGLWRKIETILGTLRRLIQRGLWHRNSYKN